MKQDTYDATSELSKLSIDVQKVIKKAIDQKQDKLIAEIQKNRKAITQGLLDKIPAQEQLAIEPKSPLLVNLDKGFHKNEMETLIKQGYAPPSQIMEDQINDEIDIDEYKGIGERLKELGRQKGVLMKSKKGKAQNTERINELSKDIKLLQKYRKRIGI